MEMKKKKTDKNQRDFNQPTYYVDYLQTYAIWNVTFKNLLKCDIN